MVSGAASSTTGRGGEAARTTPAVPAPATAAPAAAWTLRSVRRSASTRTTQCRSRCRGRSGDAVEVAEPALAERAADGCGWSRRRRPCACSTRRGPSRSRSRRRWWPVDEPGVDAGDTSYGPARVAPRRRRRCRRRAAGRRRGRPAAGRAARRRSPGALPPTGMPTSPAAAMRASSSMRVELGQRDIDRRRRVSARPAQHPRHGSTVERPGVTHGAQVTARSGGDAAAQASSSSPTTETKLTQAPGPPPRLCVRALRLPVGDAGDLALAGLAAQLRPALEQHPQPGRPDRVTERLQPTVGVHRQLAVEVERPGEDLLPGEAPLGEPEVLHQHQLGRREAVVDLGHRQLGAGIVDAGLGVGVLGRAHDLGEASCSRSSDRSGRPPARR